MHQAMSAYRTASRLFPASHVPLLYMGMEYLRTNNLALAAHFLQARR
jgi:anaphase-promoting complex subunit 6